MKATVLKFLAGTGLALVNAAVLVGGLLYLSRSDGWLQTTIGAWIVFSVGMTARVLVPWPLSRAEIRERQILAFGYFVGGSTMFLALGRVIWLASTGGPKEAIAGWLALMVAGRLNGAAFQRLYPSPWRLALQAGKPRRGRRHVAPGVSPG